MQTRQRGLEGTGEVRLRDLVKECLRMRPSRIIVGEVRAEECLDLLLALNAGLPGMASLHANSARETLVKLCTLPLLSGENISARFVVPTVASSVDLVVHLGSTVEARWCSYAGARASCAPVACRRGWTGSPRPTSTSTPCSPRNTRAPCAGEV